MAGGIGERPGEAGAAAAGGGGDRQGGTAIADQPESDGDVLARLFEDARQLINAVIRHPDWQNLPSDEGWAEAWREAMRAADPRFDLLISNLRQPGIEPYLASEGLTGRELQVKTAVYWAVRPHLDDLVSGGGRLVGRILRPLGIDLQAVINILGSLTGLPLAGPLAELLNAALVALDVLEYLAEPEPGPEPA